MLSFTLRILSTYATFYALSSFKSIDTTTIQENISHETTNEALQPIYGIVHGPINNPDYTHDTTYTTDDIESMLCESEKSFTKYRTHLVQLSMRYSYNRLIVRQLYNNLVHSFSRLCRPHYQIKEAALYEFTRLYYWIR